MHARITNCKRPDISRRNHIPLRVTQTNRSRQRKRRRSMPRRKRFRTRMRIMPENIRVSNIRPRTIDSVFQSKRNAHTRSKRKTNNSRFPDITIFPEIFVSQQPCRNSNHQWSYRLRSKPHRSVDSQIFRTVDVA